MSSGCECIVYYGGTGFVLAADLPRTDEQDELDEERLICFSKPIIAASVRQQLIRPQLQQDEGCSAVPSTHKKNVGFSAVGSLREV